MKKFFSFSQTISGKTFLLRTLFTVVLSFPILIALISKWTSYFMSLGDFDFSDASIENQMEIQSFGDELAQKIAKNPEFYLNDFINRYSDEEFDSIYLAKGKLPSDYAEILFNLKIFDRLTNFI